MPIFKTERRRICRRFWQCGKGRAVGSDVDILVKFASRPTFAGYLRLDDALRASLGREIDLVTVGGVNKFCSRRLKRFNGIIWTKTKFIFPKLKNFARK